MQSKNPARIALAWVLVLAGAVEFFLRVFVAFVAGPFSDIAAPYVSTRLWLQGSDPYDAHLFLPALVASGQPLADVPTHFKEAYSIYPPTAFPIVAPFALLHWIPFEYLFLVVSMLLYGLVIYALLRTGWPGQSLHQISRNPSAVLFLAFSLGFAPVHTALRSMNIVVISGSLAILGVLLLLKTRTSSKPGWLAGIATAFSICLKPTTGVFVLPWLVRQRYWKIFLGVLCLCAAITTTALVPMFIAHRMVWLTSYHNSVQHFFAPNAFNSIYPSNDSRTDRIDLQLVLFAITNNQSLSSSLAMLAYIGLMAAFLWNAGWSKASERASLVNHQPILGTAARWASWDLSLLVAAGSLAISLIPVYSREYSAMVLLLLVLWCFRKLHLKSARWLLFLLCDFLVNTATVVRRVVEPKSVARHHQDLWDATIGGHECWLLLAIGCLLVWAVREQRREDLALLETQPLIQPSVIQPMPA